MFCIQRCVCLTLLFLSLPAGQVHAENLTTATVLGNIDILKETGNCPQCDLSGANLSRFDLSGANLAGVNLSRSKLALANLSDANLQGADLRETNFSGADLGNTDMRGADLTGAVFVGAYMVGALLDGEMISVAPYANDEISDVEESVYVEDTAKSKKPQETEELLLGSRRDLEQTPPTIPTISAKEKRVNEEITELDDGTTFAYDETPEEILPNRSLVAPAAKTAPAIDAVRIQKDNAATDDLPEFVDTKKEPVLEVAEKASVASNHETDQSSVERTVAEANQADLLVSKEVENTVEGTTNEAVNSSSEPVEIGDGEEKKVERKDATEENTASTIVAEESGKVPSGKEEADGIVQSVLNLLSSTELSTEVLRNAAQLIDSNVCYHCDLQGVNLRGENLDGADLEGANLSNAILKDVDLEGANLRGTNLSGADLSGADLSEADLYKADLSGANLTDTNLEKARLDAVDFTDVTGYSSPGLLLFEAQ